VKVVDGWSFAGQLYVVGRAPSPLRQRTMFVGGERPPLVGRQVSSAIFRA
jgi:hypothetical protein